MNDALCALTDQITTMEKKCLDSLFIVLGDFTTAKLTRNFLNTDSILTAPPGTISYWTTVTPVQRMPKLCCMVSFVTFCSLPFLPYSRQQLKRTAVKTLTDWNVFEAASDNLDELTDTVTS